MATHENNCVTPDRLAGTKTEQNLHTALSGESQAYLRYRWFESKAREEGYVEIANIFRETAGNEKEHAEIWFRCLGGRSDTGANLETAAGGEHFEWATMYSEFEETAKAEGFPELAHLFAMVGAIERQHEERYLTYMNKVKNGACFTSDSEATCWICLNCGHVAVGKEPPKVCPVCSHAEGYFKKQS